MCIDRLGKDDGGGCGGTCSSATVGPLGGSGTLGGVALVGGNMTGVGGGSVISSTAVLASWSAWRR